MGRCNPTFGVNLPPPPPQRPKFILFACPNRSELVDPHVYDIVFFQAEQNERQYCAPCKMAIGFYRLRFVHFHTDGGQMGDSPPLTSPNKDGVPFTQGQILRRLATLVTNFRERYVPEHSRNLRGARSRGQMPPPPNIFST